MKIFAVYGKLEIENSPKWLEDFVKKYKFDYDFHITFKQPCFINAGQIDNIKKTLSDILAKTMFPNHKIEMIFNKVVPNKDKDCVMLGAEDNLKLSRLQKKILMRLKNYQSYCEPETKEYEENFKPHLTIAMDLDKNIYQKALSDIPTNFQINGEIKKIILATVNKNSSDESKNPSNLHVFKF